MKLLLDENLSPNQAAILREQGYDAVAVVDVGLSGESDERIREFAIAENRVLLTLDVDFANTLRFPPAGTPGVIRFKIHPPRKRLSANSSKRHLHYSPIRHLPAASRFCAGT